MNFYFRYKFVSILVIKTWIRFRNRIRIGIQPKMQDPDPESMNVDPKSVEILNPQILRLIPLSKIRKFLRCAGPQIANYIFFGLIHKLQIRKFLQNTAKRCIKIITLSHKFELEH